jgi:hypothetical protein
VKWILAAALCACGAGSTSAGERREVPSYTNEDLERVRPRRGETGVDSSAAVPAPRALPAAAPGRPGQRTPSAEASWRREAERQRGRMESFRREVALLELKIAERQRKPGVRPYSDPALERYRARIAELRERAREEEGRFLDRARREGALPGWLR